MARHKPKNTTSKRRPGVRVPPTRRPKTLPLVWRIVIEVAVVLLIRLGTMITPPHTLAAVLPQQAVDHRPR
ncbi:MAG TPA: hypothetical protein VGG39_37730 [Polyangiaceae bacterium]|jgi:hypothetical protein